MNRWMECRSKFSQQEAQIRLQYFSVYDTIDIRDFFKCLPIFVVEVQSLDFRVLFKSSQPQILSSMFIEYFPVA